MLLRFDSQTKKYTELDPNVFSIVTNFQFDTMYIISVTKASWTDSGNSNYQHHSNYLQKADILKIEFIIPICQWKCVLYSEACATEYRGQGTSKETKISDTHT